MSIPLTCPSCAAGMTVLDAAAGRTVRCPKCNAPIGVPSAKRAAIAEAEDDDDVVLVYPRREQSSGAWLKPVVLVGVAIVALAFIGLVIREARTQNQEPAPRLLTPAIAPMDSGARNVFDIAPEGPWASDPAFDDRLGPYQTVAGLQIRPPKGYKFEEAKEKFQGRKLFVWTGTRREDGTAPSLILEVLNPPPEAERPDLSQFLNDVLDIYARQMLDSQVDIAEFNLMNGETFARTRWTGRHKTTKASMRGVTYAVIPDTNTFVHLMTQDLDPGHEDDLALAEAAILTLRKKK